MKSHTFSRRAVVADFNASQGAWKATFLSTKAQMFLYTFD